MATTAQHAGSLIGQLGGQLVEVASERDSLREQVKHQAIMINELILIKEKYDLLLQQNPHLHIIPTG